MPRPGCTTRRARTPRAPTSWRCCATSPARSGGATILSWSSATRRRHAGPRDGAAPARGAARGADRHRSATSTRRSPPAHRARWSTSTPAGRCPAGCGATGAALASSAPCVAADTAAMRRELDRRSASSTSGSTTSAESRLAAVLLGCSRGTAMRAGDELQPARWATTAAGAGSRCCGGAGRGGLATRVGRWWARRPAPPRGRPSGALPDVRQRHLAELDRIERDVRRTGRLTARARAPARSAARCATVRDRGERRPGATMALADLARHGPAAAGRAGRADVPAGVRRRRRRARRALRRATFDPGPGRW